MMKRFRKGRHFLPGQFYFPQHAQLFFAVTLIVLSVKGALATGWPLFWPLFVWGLAVAIHYFFAAAFNINEAWTEDKVQDVKSRSYDFGHILNIESRIDKAHYSVSPHTERDG